MPVAAICSSHTPLLWDKNGVTEETLSNVRDGFERLVAFVDDFKPDCIIQFSPDHFNGFFYDLMPSFCVGMSATSIGDWNTKAGPLPVDPALAAAVLDAVRAADIDAAVSYQMNVDHGFTQILEAVFGDAGRYPIVPVFINCIAKPMPTYRRARQFGEAVGRFAAASGKRVLIVASGGLSHDPPVPDIDRAPPEVRQRLLGGGRNVTPEGRIAREKNVRDAAALSARGEGPCRPLNPAWDKKMLDLLRDGDLDALERLDTGVVQQEAGNGGNELLVWVAACAALAGAGPYSTEVLFYEAVPAWIAGFGMWAARGQG
jgi:2,3-dihydroxyphenylpropionate 1,2-dioxygenase